MDSLHGNEIEGLEDSALDHKISIMKRLLELWESGHSRAPSDNGQRVKRFLQRLLAERERRNQLPRQKAETSKAATARRSEMIETRRYLLPKKVKQRKRTRNHEFSSRYDDSSYRPNKCFSTKGKHGNFLSNQIPEQCRFSDLLGEEKDCRRLTTGKRKEALSHTQQGQTKKKVARLIVLDEEDHEQPKEHQTHRLRKILPNKCFSKKGKHGNFLSNQIPEQSRLSDLLGEEKDCRRLTTRKRKEALSHTQQGQTKKKVARLSVLDEEDHEQPKEHQTHRLRKILPNKCFSTKRKHGKFLSNQIPKQRRLSDLLGEEKDCRRLTTGKGKEALSHTQQGQTKKKVAMLIVLDEKDHKQPKEQQTHRLCKSLRNNMPKDLKVYYPARDDPESVEICYLDMECLAPFSYLSSPIMNFYIRYLQSPESIITSKQCTDYYFCNTYFYSKLDEALQNHRRQQDGVSLAKLRRWLKGVNIFEKAYIFVPIYYRLHWSLAVICIPAREDKIGPIILHMDSLGLHTSNIIFQNIESFLKAEWEHLNQAGVPTHIPIEESIRKTWISKIKTKKIEVPQQENDYDCGLFVLYFMERFIKDAPPRLIMSDLDMFGKKWFRPAEASRLRDSIKTLLVKHFEDAKNKFDAIDN